MPSPHSIRTAQGYRRVSWGFHSAIVEASKQKNVSGAAAAAAAQEVMVEGRDAQSRQRPDRFLRQERYNYMKAGQLLMKDWEVVSVAADAGVGNDHILNVFLWNNVAEKAFHCPPQALASVLDLFLSEMSEFPQSERRHMPEAPPYHICRKRLSATYAGSVSLNGPRTYAGSVSPFCGQNHLKKDDFGISPTYAGSVSLKVRNTKAGSVSPFSPDQKKKSLRPTYAGSVSLKGPKHICRKCLSVFARPKGKKPTAHICRKCLSATCAGSVSLNPVFGDVFFISKKTILATFRRPKWFLEKRPLASFLQGTLPRSPGARSPALCGPESKARALKTARPARPEALDVAVSLTPRARGLSQHPGTVSEACFSSLRHMFPCAEACHVRVSPLLHFGKDKHSVLRATCATAFTCAGLCLQLNSDRGFPWIVIAVRLQPLRPDGTRT